MNRNAHFKEVDLYTLQRQSLREYEEFRARGLVLDMTRGKPAPEQLDLANEMLALPGPRDHLADVRDASEGIARCILLAAIEKHGEWSTAPAEQTRTANDER